MEQQIFESVRKIEESEQRLKKKVESQDELIKLLKSNIKLEKYKVSLLSKVLKKVSGIDVSDIYEEDNVEGHLVTYTKIKKVSGCKGDVSASTKVKEIGSVKPSPQIKPQPCPNKSFSEEEVLKCDVATLTNQLKQSLEQFNQTKLKRDENKLMVEMKDIRKKILEQSTTSGYVEFLREQHGLIRKPKLFPSIFSSYEQRLLNIPHFSNNLLSFDDIQSVDNSIKLYYQAIPKQSFKVDLLHDITHYAIALYPIESLLEKIFSCITFKSVVYASTNKKLEGQNITFYMFDREDEEGRNMWNIDHQLLSTSTRITTFLLQFCISLYRTIYRDFYGDNNFREHSQDGELFDIKILYNNIITLSKPKEFREKLQQIIVKECTLSITSNDKFDFKTDNKMLKQESNVPDCKTQVFDSLNRLYDNLTIETFQKMFP